MPQIKESHCMKHYMPSDLIWLQDKQNISIDEQTANISFVKKKLDLSSVLNKVYLNQNECLLKSFIQFLQSTANVSVI